MIVDALNSIEFNSIEFNPILKSVMRFNQAESILTKSYLLLPYKSIRIQFVIIHSYYYCRINPSGFNLTYMVSIFLAVGSNFFNHDPR